MRLNPPPADASTHGGVYVDSVETFMPKDQGPRLVQHVKFAVYHLLTKTVNKVWKDECYGCLINHPSQRQHSCLEEVPEYFLQAKYDAIMNMLWNDNFLVTIRSYLFLKRMLCDPVKIAGVVEFIMAELLEADNFAAILDKQSDDVSKHENFWLIYDERVKISNTWEPKPPTAQKLF